MKLVKLRDTKFCDGGTLVSSIRVTAPIFVAGKKGRIVFSVALSKHLPLLIGRYFLTPARAVVNMGEKTLRIGTGVDDLVVSRAGHLALRLNPQDWHRESNLIEDLPVRHRARRKKQDPRTEKLHQLRQLPFRGECAESLQIVSEKCRSIATSR